MEIVAWIFGVIGVSFGVFCACRLRQWERQLAGARIAIAYKQKIRLQAPLVEWLMWANKLADDELSTGRVVYRQANTSVAILKPRPKHGKQKSKIVNTEPERKQVVTPATGNK